jgi:hypothetical protein
MRKGIVVLMIWLVIGVVAAAQRDYFSGSDPKIKCETPQPSK